MGLKGECGSCLISIDRDELSIFGFFLDKIMIMLYNYIYDKIDKCKKF